MNDEHDVVLDHEEGIDDSVVAEESAHESVKKLKDKLKDSESKAKEYLDKWQRAQADFVNLRKKDEEAKVDFLKFANAGLIEELMPVLDGLSLAVAHGDKGVEQIYTLLLKILKQQGLEEIDPMGQTFDPNMHEAVGMLKVEKKEDDHKILEVFQKGYTLNGRVLRPAKVKIGEFS